MIDIRHLVSGHPCVLRRQLGPFLIRGHTRSLDGRLAIDQGFKGQGLGSALLADVLDRAKRSEIAAFALMLNAKAEVAAKFYLHHGFVALPDPPLIYSCRWQPFRAFEIHSFGL